MTKVEVTEVTPRKVDPHPNCKNCHGTGVINNELTCPCTVDFTGAKIVKKKVDMKIGILHPTVPESKNLMMDDVWGKHTEHSPIKWFHHGMLVATSHDDGLPKVCPVWGDKLPYKSVTVICRPSLEEEVIYWLEYVHGGGSISRRKVIDKNKVALRSDYQCW